MLSLEAPAVAVLWTLALARLNDLPVLPGVLPGLGLAVWIIYVADRLLDTLSLPPDALSLRHRFHQRHRGWLAAAVGLALAGLIWLAFWVVPAGLLVLSLTLLLPVALYLAFYSGAAPRVRLWLTHAGVFLLLLVVNALPLALAVKMTVSLALLGGYVWFMRRAGQEGAAPWLRKEVAAGLLFALGCTTWNRFHQLGQSGPDGWVETLVLALLFSANLAVITRHEEGDRRGSEAAGPTLLASGLLLAAAAAAALQGWLPERLLSLALAALAGLTALGLLWRCRRALSAEAFRVWADLAVLLPALLLLLLTWLRAATAAACCP